MKSYLLCGACAVLLSGCVSAPQPMDMAESTSNAQNLQANVASGQEPISGPVDLYEAMARALKYNLPHRVAMMEADIARRDYDLSHYNMLPQVVAGAGYYSRNNDNGSSSRSLLSGRQSLEPSTSTERDVFDADLRASWNILDFGLSYVRARQTGNQALIVEERRRKAVIQLMEDVHRAYWRAASAQRLLDRLENLEAEAEAAFQASQRQFRDGRTAPMPALAYQRELTEIRAEAQKLRRELSLAKMELASLMNVPPGVDFVLAVPSHQGAPARLNMDLPEMVSTALINRPEIRESAYMVEIGEDELKVAALEALPGLELFTGVNTNSNDFLYNNDWVGSGARVAWNLIDVFETPKRKARAGANLELEKTRAMATAMAVMTQVSVARSRYEFLQEEYETAQRAVGIQDNITAQTDSKARVNATSTQTLVRERMNLILAEARRDVIHAEMREASAHIYTAMGYEPYSAEIDGTESIEEIAGSLRVMWMERAQFTLNYKPAETPNSAAVADVKTELRPRQSAELSPAQRAEK